MKQFFNSVLEIFTMIGCARAAADLARMGHFEAARNLILQSDKIKKARRERKEMENEPHPVLQ